MSRIRAANTTPELAVRRLVHSAGYRYRLHVSHLPGKPDLVFPGRRAVIFVHGCFWHLHRHCKEGRVPSSNQDYWLPKLARNVARDRKNALALNGDGWRVMEIWECQIHKDPDLMKRIAAFLDYPFVAKSSNLK